MSCFTIQRNSSFLYSTSKYISPHKIFKHLVQNTHLLLDRLWIWVGLGVGSSGWCSRGVEASTSDSWPTGLSIHCEGQGYGATCALWYLRFPTPFLSTLASQDYTSNAEVGKVQYIHCWGWSRSALCKTCALISCFSSFYSGLFMVRKGPTRTGT